MLVALDKGGEVGSCPPQPHLSSHFGRPGLKSDGLLPFKTIVLSFKSRLAFYRVFFGSGSSSCGVRGKGQKERGSSSLRLFPTVFIISPVGTCFSSPGNMFIVIGGVGDSAGLGRSVFCPFRHPSCE